MLDMDYSTETYWLPPSSQSSINFSNGSDNVSSEDNKTSSLTSDFKRDEDLAKIEMAVLALIFILTVLGNCVVLLGIFFRRQKMTRMYYFILHLSVADLITAFFNVLTQLCWEITYRFQGGNFLCKFVKYTQILGPYSSSYVLVMTAMDRYQAICYPLSNCTWTAKRSKIMLGIAWAISNLCCLPQLFIFSYQQVKPASETEPAEYDCWGTFPENGAKIYVTWYSITVFIIPLVILVFAYSCITRAIWINFNMKNANKNQDNYEKPITRQDSDEGESQSFEQSSAVYRYPVLRKTKRKNKLNINLYKSSRKALQKKVSIGSTTSGSGSGGVSIENGESESIRRNVNNIANKISSSTSTTQQSSAISPFKNDHQMLSSVNNCSGVRFKEENGELDISELSLNGNKANGNIEKDVCQHGCLINRCNFCRTSSQNERWNSFKIKEPNEKNCPKENNCSRPLLRPNKSEITRRESKHGGMSVGKYNCKSRKSSAVATYGDQQPRTHSVKGISRAKIKTIKLTVTIICCYIFCSSPFIAAQLWSVYDPYAYSSTFFTGPTFTILTLLASLNSCVNPYIFLFFNPNLLENCFQGIFRPKFPTRRQYVNNNGSPLSRSLSLNKNKTLLSVGGGTTGSSGASSLARNHVNGVTRRSPGLVASPNETSVRLSPSPPSPFVNPSTRETQVVTSFSNGAITIGTAKATEYLKSTLESTHPLTLITENSISNHSLSSSQLLAPLSPSAAPLLQPLSHKQHLEFTENDKSLPQSNNQRHTLII